MIRYKKSSALKVQYVALHKTTGLLDLEMKVYDEAGALFTTVTLTAVPSNGGAYYGSFTPDAKGQWRIRIQSTANQDDIQKIFEIGNSDADEIKLQTQSIEDKADIIDGVVDAVKGVVDSIETKTDIIDGVVDSIETKTDIIDGVVDSIETKTDIIDGNVDQSLVDIAAVKSVVDAIDLQISAGGYIMN